MILSFHTLPVILNLKFMQNSLKLNTSILNADGTKVTGHIIDV